MHSLVSFLNSIIFSLTLIDVSFGWVLGRVDFGINPDFLPLRYAATQRSRVLCPPGNTEAISFSFICLLMMGIIHLSRSSRALFGSFVHIWPYIGILVEKPPYVCAHYPWVLTKNIVCAKIESVLWYHFILIDFWLIIELPFKSLDLGDLNGSSINIY